VEQMSVVAERIAGGDLELEVPRRGRDEISRLAAAVNGMKQSLVGKLGELEEERSLLSSVIAEMKEGLLMVGLDRRIHLANRAARRIFDVAFDPAGHPLTDVVRHPAVISSIEEGLEQRAEIREQTLELPASGQSFELHVTPLEGSASGVIVLFFEITHLEALERVRREFVADVSHELRTPLTSIKAFVETLLGGASADEKRAKEFLEIIAKHADRMGVLIDDITDLSRIETGAVELDLRPLDVALVAAEVAENLRPLGEEKQVKVELALESPLMIRADRRRLEQILTNLVDNAIKFNRPLGQVRIESDLREGRPTLIVEDSGVGIPADSHEKVFHRFYRVDPARSREAGGTGLGLAIVKHLMRLHGGRVTLASTLGQGSRFTLEFPSGSESEQQPG